MGKNILFFGVIVLVSVCFAGCRTTGAERITELAVSGGIEIGRLEQLDKELGRISQQARDELSRAGTSVDDLAGIIRRVFDIAYGLCDEIEGLRAEIRAIKENYKDTTGDTNNLDGSQDG